MSIRVRTSVLALVALSLITLIPALGAAPRSQAPAQTAAATATLTGIVTDKDGGFVPGASVVVTNIATGQKLSAVVTDKQGAYLFLRLAPGQYKVTITLSGFKTMEITVTLVAGSTATIPTKMEVGRREEVVNVKAGADLYRTETPTVTSAVGSTISGLPGRVGGAGGGGGRGAAAATPPAQSSGVSADFIQTLPRADRNALNFLVYLDGVKQSEIGERRYQHPYPAPPSGETYDRFRPNQFNSTYEQPLSTFGADVDTASYSNIRRFLSSGQLPPSEAVRIEELVNYFHFGYAGPRDGRPMALTTETGECPWAPGHKLVLIGARAAAPVAREITGRNLVLLIDVSGSMAPPERLPLIKTALALFVDTLKPNDVLSIVTYAGSSGVALPPTRARNRNVILNAIESLNASGSTNGGEGLMLAYRLARQSFIQGGVNRVILATDGDFNVGITSQQQLLQLIESERDSGVFLSVFGVGSGNLKDATMEMLADRGNGNYAYLDSLQEARRVLIREGDATIDTVAKDVKFQVEFNPAVVAAWKLIGYENRALRAQDFNNDRKDAGEMGAGHTVTVLYEVIPVGAERPRDDVERDYDRPAVDPLRYQQQQPEFVRPRPVTATTTAAMNGEWLTVKARYKQPDRDTSELITLPVRASARTQFLPLASAIAEFGLILRDAPRNMERWDALRRRVERLGAPESIATEFSGFKELVATAAGLARIR